MEGDGRQDCREGDSLRRFDPSLKRSHACARYAHKYCKGNRSSKENPGHLVRCECPCHMKVCPECDQPRTGATQRALLVAAQRLEAMAQELRKKSNAAAQADAVPAIVTRA
jgi:hypothetical protein